MLYLICDFCCFYFSGKATPVPSPSKSSAGRPPRRQLLSTSTAGDETSGPSGASNDLIFAPQVSKESKLSVYDLDDESETGKAGSIQVFDLGESSSEDKFGKSKSGAATKVFKFFLIFHYFILTSFSINSFRKTNSRY